MIRVVAVIINNNKIIIIIIIITAFSVDWEIDFVCVKHLCMFTGIVLMSYISEQQNVLSILNKSFRIILTFPDD